MHPINDDKFIEAMTSRLLHNVVKSEDDRREWSKARIVGRRNAVLDKLAVPAAIACGRSHNKQTRMQAEIKGVT